MAKVKYYAKENSSIGTEKLTKKRQRLSNFRT